VETSTPDGKALGKEGKDRPARKRAREGRSIIGALRNARSKGKVRRAARQGQPTQPSAHRKPRKAMRVLRVAPSPSALLALVLRTRSAPGAGIVRRRERTPIYLWPRVRVADECGVCQAGDVVSRQYG
jgi:hypothetical protein